MQPRAKRYQRKDGMAVSRNLSATGMLMATAAELRVGTAVTVTFNLTLKEDAEHTVQGQIVRVEENASDPQGMWPHHVAVQFDDPLANIEPLLDELPASQRSTL
jgi:hypothetical protein